ncbi:MAG: sugar phosphate isomerase/epimerase [Eubacterium sp.]|nr:sugar phosphate isomerase/epimerase [Eubacterium sp.]
MDVGVSTACLYPLETEKALAELAVRGIKNVEIFMNAVTELEGEILADMQKTLTEYDISVKSVHPFSSPMETLFLFGNYARRTEYLIDMYKRYFETMNKLGAKIFVLHGAILSSKVPDDVYLERYLRLFRVGKEYGITVVQENVSYCKSSSVELLEKMSNQLGDEVRFVVDVKQARRSNVDPFVLLDRLGEKIVHLHLSDGNEASDCMPIGKGEFDFNRLFNKLDELRYSGTMIVELYRENYRSYDELTDCAKTLEKLLAAHRGAV